MFKAIPTLLCDFYKISHRKQYPENTTLVYSNLTPRSGKYYKGITKNKVVFFGLQYFVKHVLIDMFNENFFNLSKQQVVAEYARVIKYCLGEQSPDTTHIEALHDLGYLPLHIKSLPELALVDYQVPALTIVNTDNRFYWLTNFIETVLSADLWMLCNNATLAYDYHNLCNTYADKTCDNNEHLPFQCHDFSFRGMAGHDAAMLSGMAHLQYFKGTDTIQSISALEYYYSKNIETELVGTSMPASEHAVMCAGGKDTEEETYRRFIEDLYPTGLVSIVSDTWDFFGVLTNILPKLKDKIMARDGKVVIRPDSGDPVDIICGSKYHIIKSSECGGSEETYESLPYHLYRFYIDLEFDIDNTLYLNEKTGVYYTLSVQYLNTDGSCGDLFINQPYDFIETGAIELLWNLFGGTFNDKGYKVLDSHIGLIYGDSITLERAKEIFERLEAKGFASSNVVFGVGSYTYQYNTRDSQGWAVKATYCEVNGEGRAIFKEPKTDTGKKSAKGLLQVVKDGDNYKLIDNVSWAEEQDGELKTVFRNGVLYK